MLASVVVGTELSGAYNNSLVESKHTYMDEEYLRCLPLAVADALGSRSLHHPLDAHCSGVPRQHL
jgi:hypothetical protein